MTAPLLVTNDPAARDDLLRLAAAAGVTPEIATDPAAALRHWTSSPLVLVGADLAAPLAELAPGRRDAVHVVSWGRAADDLFRVALALGAQDVTELPGSEAWVVEALTDVGDRARAPGLVVGVVGGSGGAGATTLACALAQTAARRGGDAVVLDCDPLGPGADTVLGLDGVDGFRWDALCQTTGRFSARALREALPAREGLGVLTWHPGSRVGLQAFAVREALSAARRGHASVVVDLPRTVDPLVEEVAARCDVLLVVVVPTVAGVASAARLSERLADRASARAVLRGAGLEEREVARATRLPVLDVVPRQRALAESVDLGLGPVRSRRSPLARTCRGLLDACAEVAAGLREAA